MQIQTFGGDDRVVVSRELPEQPDQMALVDHDDVVQAFPAENPHQSLGDRIRLRPELGSTFAPDTTLADPVRPKGMSTTVTESAIAIQAMR